MIATKIIFGFLLLVFVTQANAVPAEKCQPGKSYKVDCNNCICDANGNLACTLKLCHQKRSPAECEEGQFKTEDCNSCRCIRGGHWACTRVGCFTIRQKRDSGECTPKETKSLANGCNECVCLDTGKWACKTTNAPHCDSTPHFTPFERKKRETCKIGDVKQEDCNRCRCVKGGLWACTKKLCLGDSPKAVPF